MGNLIAVDALSNSASNNSPNDLCCDYPTHTDADAIYAASIERRSNKKEEETADSFYLSQVDPAVQASGLDEWIDEARSADPDSDTALGVMIKVHKLTVDLFNPISGKDNRSLASNCLHFHVPGLFYILDSRAEKAMGALIGSLGKAGRPTTSGDPKYCGFVAKCGLLKSRCETEFGIRLSPRKLDNLLLAAL